MRAYKGFDYKNLRPRLTRISTRPNFERVWSTMDFTCSTFETSIANLSRKTLYFLDHRQHRIRRQRRNDNVGAGLCESGGTRASDTTATAGNNRGPTFQGKAREIDRVHVTLSSSCKNTSCSKLCHTQFCHVLH